jgi:hypothetical protein
MNKAERKEIITRARDPNRDDWPAELRELPTERMRAFVVHYVANRNAAGACREAGYLSPDASAEQFAKQGYKLLCDDRIVAAIGAIVKRQIRSLGPAAAEALRSILVTPYHKDQARVALAIAERIEPTAQKVDVTHTHKLDHDAEAEAQLRSLMALGVAREKLIEVFGEFGLQRLETKIGIEAKPAEIIDGDYSEVERDPDADLLGE